MLELLVATAVTGMLIVGAVAIFLNWRSSTGSAQGIAQVQERGRRALEEISQAIRSAGFGGCARAPANVGSSIDAKDARFDFMDSAIRGYEGNSDGSWIPSLDQAWVPEATPERDVLLVRGPRSHSDPLHLTAPMARPDDALIVGRGQQSRLAGGDVAMIASCQARAFFVVTSYEDDVLTHGSAAIAQTGLRNRSESLGYAFGAGAEIVPVETTLYYLRTDANAQRNASSLWRRIGTHPPQLILSGVRDLQLEFGIDLDFDDAVDAYRPASEVADWRDVRSVSVALQLLRDDTASREATHVAAKDSLTFRTTVAMRNASLDVR